MQHKVDFVSLGPEMHHCSSITRGLSGHWLTFYHGRECTDEQRVAVCYREIDDKNPITAQIELDHKTGNPIIWTFKSQTYLMYSKFMDSTEDGIPIDYGRSPVNRWKNCENFLAKLHYCDGKIECEELGRISGAYGLLGRCQPLVEEDRVLLPLYREENPACQVWEFTVKDNEPSLSRLSEFGGVTEEIRHNCSKMGLEMGMLGDGVAIQPTIIKNGDRYIALCRNVCRPSSKAVDKNCMAWATSSLDCEKWDPLRMAGIPNHNNSLVAISRDDGDDLVVFNSDRSRSDMILYGIKARNKINLNHMLKNSRSSFSYPNMMIDDGNLHVVHTNCGMIAWHQFDKGFMQKAL